jgi:hypothetical protein
MQPNDGSGAIAARAASAASPSSSSAAAADVRRRSRDGHRRGRPVSQGGPGRISRIAIVSVRSVQPPDGGKSFTVYRISTATENSLQNYEIERRYSHFVVLEEELRAAGARSLPDLPPKRAFGNLGAQFVEQRRVALQQFLQALIRHPQVGGATGAPGDHVSMTLQYFLGLNLGTDLSGSVTGFGWATRTHTNGYATSKDVQVGGGRLTPMCCLCC